MNHKQEIGVGIFFFILAALYLAGSLSISSFDPFGNSTLTSKAIPQLIGGLMAVLSIIHIAGNALKLKRTQTSNETGKAGGTRFEIGRSGWLMLLSVLFICAYIFLFTRLGFILSTILFLLAEMFLLIPAEKRKRWAIFIVCFSTGLSILLYLLFTKLSMFLPRGLLG
ncbi:MAG: tripartite tricarboxylate transporter TctB family protein [Candidatus Accumulibacter sp.]|jgi:putative tricarboxylic transport membrane protein|nr:tripartite tricarboxylate transporter TctB family protein [Accumulibacter sp.]